MHAKSDAAASVTTTDREILATRVFDAPPDLVFAMFRDPKHVSRWWGPRGFATTTFSQDFRPGGVWRFVMHGPDGTDYHNKITYTDIVDGQRVAYHHEGCGDHSPIRFDVVITFEPAPDDQTRMTFRMLFATQADRDFKQGAVEGLAMTVDRLGEQLADHRAGNLPFVISRTFDAPRDLVWQMWIRREHLMHWFGPKGFTMTAATLDFRPGGSFHYCLRSGGGQEMWGKFLYRDVIPHHRIVHLNCFSDPAGNVVRPPFDDDWPRQMLTTTSFAELDGRTTVTIEWSAYNATDAERRTFYDNFPSMTAGWTGTFEQLEAYLTKVQR